MARGFGSTWGVDNNDQIITAYTGNNSQITLSIWTYMQGLGEGAGGNMLYKNNEFFLRNLGGGSPEFQHWFSGTDGKWRSASAQTWIDSLWHHVAITYDNSDVANNPVMYFNGSSISISEIATPSGTADSNSNAVYIGNYAHCWDGMLAEAAIFDRILSSDEIEALGNGVSPFCVRSSPVSYTPMVNSLIDRCAGGTVSVTQTVVQDHPRIYYPRIFTIGVPSVTGPQSIGLSVATATATGLQPTAVPGSINAPMDVATATALGLQPTAVPGSINAPVDTATAIATGFKLDAYDGGTVIPTPANAVAMAWSARAINSSGYFANRYGECLMVNQRRMSPEDAHDDFWFNIALRKAHWMDVFHQWGWNKDIDIADAPEDMWPEGDDYNFITTPAALEIIGGAQDLNTAGSTGAWTVHVWGLDTNYEEIDEVIAMNAAVGNPLVNSYLRINRAQVATAGSGGANAADITIQDVVGGTVRCVIPQGMNKSQQAVYTVPAHKNAFIYHAYINQLNTGFCEVALMGRGEGSIWIPEGVMSVGVAGRYDEQFRIPVRVAPKTDVKLRVLSVGQDNTQIVGGFELILQGEV